MLAPWETAYILILLFLGIIGLYKAYLILKETSKEALENS